MVRLTVRLNGTNQNPFEIWGLTQNPFPQIAKAELMTMQRKLASLGGVPIQNADDIRERLKGFDPDFIAGVITRYRPGHMVTFDITFPD